MDRQTGRQADRQIGRQTKIRGRVSPAETDRQERWRVECPS